VMDKGWRQLLARERRMGKENSHADS
jgi:hypothetical protein